MFHVTEGQLRQTAPNFSCTFTHVGKMVHVIQDQLRQFAPNFSYTGADP